jgi:hypothetical protein
MDMGVIITIRSQEEKIKKNRELIRGQAWEQVSNVPGVALGLHNIIIIFSPFPPASINELPISVINESMPISKEKLREITERIFFRFLEDGKRMNIRIRKFEEFMSCSVSCCGELPCYK